MFSSFGILFVSFLDKKHEKTTDEPPKEPEKTTTKEQEQPKTGKAKSKDRRPVKRLNRTNQKHEKKNNKGSLVFGTLKICSFSRIVTE